MFSINGGRRILKKSKKTSTNFSLEKKFLNLFVKPLTYSENESFDLEEVHLDFSLTA